MVNFTIVALKTAAELVSNDSYVYKAKKKDYRVNWVFVSDMTGSDKVTFELTHCGIAVGGVKYLQCNVKGCKCSKRNYEGSF